ncbi:MAG: hypothetical protein ACYST5_02050 [Planctomycetota bacterium]|jgi:hypothetical protein
MKKIAIFVMALLMLLATSVQADLVGLWHLDGDALDSSGNAHHGTLIGDPQWTQGLDGLGWALEFDGDDYMDCGNSQLFDMPEQITLAAWIWRHHVLQTSHNYKNRRFNHGNPKSL